MNSFCSECGDWFPSPEHPREGNHTSERSRRYPALCVGCVLDTGERASMVIPREPVRFLRSAHKGPMGQDLRNVWTCGRKDPDGRFCEHGSRQGARECLGKGEKENGGI